MKSLTQEQIIHLNPVNYSGLKDSDLFESIKKHSSFILPDAIIADDLELQVHEVSKESDLPNLGVYYFGEDIIRDGKIFYNVISEFITDGFLYKIAPSLSLIARWEESHPDSFLVKRIGFWKIDEPLSLAVSAHILENEDKGVFLTM